MRKGYEGVLSAWFADEMMMMMVMVKGLFMAVNR